MDGANFGAFPGQRDDLVAIIDAKFLDAQAHIDSQSYVLKNEIQICGGRVDGLRACTLRMEEAYQSQIIKARLSISEIKDDVDLHISGLAAQIESISSNLPSTSTIVDAKVAIDNVSSDMVRKGELSHMLQSVSSSLLNNIMDRFAPLLTSLSDSDPVQHGGLPEGTC